MSAARAILECGLRFTEALDLAERVAALEEKRIADGDSSPAIGYQLSAIGQLGGGTMADSR